MNSTDIGSLIMCLLLLGVHGINTYSTHRIKKHIVQAKDEELKRINKLL